jgi:hypothetical protein
MKQMFNAQQTLSKRMLTVMQASLLVFASAVPLLLAQSTSAAQLQNRAATIDNSNVNASDVEFQFDYTLIDTADTKAGIIYEFCTTPLGTCTLPTGMDVQSTNSHDGQTGWPTNATAFAAVSEAANVGDCTVLTNSYMNCYSRDEAVATATTGGAVQHVISGIDAPSAAQTVYIRISVYSTDAFAPGDLLDEGVVAAAFVDQLTINGRVQERLEFCVAAIGDADALPANVAACAALTDSTVDIGVIDDSTVAVAPVDTTTTNGATDDYGILMLNTNAFNGATVGYYADDASAVSAADTHNLKAFRIIPTDCNVSASFIGDGCFTSAASDNAFGTGTGSVITAGTELFGMYVPCIDTTQGTTANLGNVDSDYDGSDDDTANAAGCQNEAFASGVGVIGWNTAASTDILADSSTGVDDEIIKLRFAATASSQTPTGSYTAITTYIATPTF